MASLDDKQHEEETLKNGRRNTIKIQNEKGKGHLTTWMKVAAAVTVIRNKPSDMTARQYSDKLASEFMINQLKLRTDFEQAKVQLSDLKLKMSDGRANITNLQEHPCSSFNGAQSRVRALTPPSSSEAAVYAHENHLLSKHPPSSLQNLHETSTSSPTSSLQSSHLVQSISNLTKLLNSGTTMQDRFAAKEAVSCVKTQADVMPSDILSVSDAILKQAASVTCQVLENHPDLGDHPEFMQSVCSIVEHVLTKLGSPSISGQYPAHRSKHSYSSMLVVYMVQAPASLCVIVIESVVEALLGVCHHLTEAHRLEQAPDVNVYDNGYFLTNSLEQAVTHWGRSCCLHPQVLHDIQERLEEAILSLSDSFPLVSRHVWQVTSRIEAILQNMA